MQRAWVQSLCRELDCPSHIEKISHATAKKKKDPACCNEDQKILHAATRTRYSQMKKFKKPSPPTNLFIWLFKNLFIACIILICYLIYSFTCCLSFPLEYKPQYCRNHVFLCLKEFRTALGAWKTVNKYPLTE